MAKLNAKTNSPNQIYLKYKKVIKRSYRHLEQVEKNLNILIAYTKE